MATAFIYGSMFALAVIIGVVIARWSRSRRYVRRGPRARGRAIDLELRGRMTRKPPPARRHTEGPA